MYLFRDLPIPALVYRLASLPVLTSAGRLSCRLVLRPDSRTHYWPDTRARPVEYSVLHAPLPPPSPQKSLSTWFHPPPAQFDAASKRSPHSLSIRQRKLAAVAIDG